MDIDQIAHNMDESDSNGLETTADNFLGCLSLIISGFNEQEKDQILDKIAKNPVLLKKSLGLIFGDDYRIDTSKLNTQPLSDFIVSRPSRMRKIFTIASRFFDDETIDAIVDKLTFNSKKDDNGLELEDGEFYYDQGDDGDGH